MIEPELLFRPLEQELEPRVGQEGDRHYVSAPVLTHVDGEVALRDVEGEALAPFVVRAVLLPQARASLQDLLDESRLGELAGFPEDGH